MIDGKMIQDVAAEEAIKVCKNDLADLGDDVQELQAKLPGVSTLSAGSYHLVVTIAEGAEPAYSWVAEPAE